MRLLSDSAALLERFARTIFRTKIDAAGNRRGPPCMGDNPTRSNYTGKRWRKKKLHDQHKIFNFSLRSRTRF